ncbi:hypothetical protein CYMTET_5978 [Cymbomonas tetramitiformis]|uniref:Uncharacterized protein n=1 Tax=Cymbomonas tetramitiformis TaxID=36881 RepID=A0AAE0H019_9CHLO|nr:hypothetical protein CYMTET_5978 [Cymbomonas tetramitiformis]
MGIPEVIKDFLKFLLHALDDSGGWSALGASGLHVAGVACFLSGGEEVCGGVEEAGEVGTVLYDMVVGNWGGGRGKSKEGMVGWRGFMEGWSQISVEGEVKRVVTHCHIREWTTVASTGGRAKLVREPKSREGDGEDGMRLGAVMKAIRQWWVEGGGGGIGGLSGDGFQETSGVGRLVCEHHHPSGKVGGGVASFHTEVEEEPFGVCNEVTEAVRGVEVGWWRLATAVIGDGSASSGSVEVSFTFVAEGLEFGVYCMEKAACGGCFEEAETMLKLLQVAPGAKETGGYGVGDERGGSGGVAGGVHTRRAP